MKSNKGFTIPELLVTMIISGIFVLIVGSLLVVAVKSQFENEKLIELDRDYRYCRAMIEKKLRNASTITTTYNLPGSSIEIQDSNGITDTIAFNDNGHNINMGALTLLSEVQYLQFSKIDPKSIVVDIQYQRRISNSPPVDELIHSSFTVTCRNM